MKTKAALLARVSSEKQEDNSSLDGQLARGRAFCQANDIEVVIARKEIFSGAFVLARSVFNELLDMLARQEINVIVVDAPDRLGRGDVIAKCELLAQLNGGSILYAQPGHDTSTVEGMALKAVKQLTSGIERLEIGRRTNGGRYDLAKSGRVIAPPRRPYGYQIVNQFNERGRKTACTLEIYEPEAKVVRMIYQWLVDECLSIYRLALRLSEMGVPRISDTDPDHKRIYAKRYKNQLQGWSRSMVASILNNPLYKGEWRFGKVKSERFDTPTGIKRKSTRRQQDSTVPVSVPAIVSERLWQAAQEQLAENRRKFVRPTKRQYLLRGRIRCALCGARMKSDAGGDTRYYRCTRTTGDYVHDPSRCQCGLLNADRVEDDVWNVLRDALLEDDRLWTGIHKQNEEKDHTRHLIEQSLAALAAMDSKDNDRLGRLLDLYLAGGMDKSAYLAKKAEVEKALAARRDETANLREQLNSCPIILPEQEQTLRQFQAEIAVRMTDDVPFEDKRLLLELLRVECIYDSETKVLSVNGLMGQLVSTYSR
jgi:site-specific DNA recombinase